MGVTAMINDGSYGDLVKIHSEMSHNMHNMGTLTSQLRFLSWHRAYLMIMEQELQKRNKDAFIPYWNWVDAKAVPPWLDSFRPTVPVDNIVVDGKPVKSVENKRNKLTKPITTQARINVLLGIDNYPDFTDELEQDPHNSGHVALGWPMRRVPVAPSDPIFWMHHGMVDRVWALWQADKTHSGMDPKLSGKDAKMDPWEAKYNVTNLSSIQALGYSYGAP
jgi:tyrosinase